MSAAVAQDRGLSLGRNDYDLVHCFGSVSVYEFHPLFAELPNVITPYESHALYLASAARQGDLGARLRLPLARRFERFMFYALRPDGGDFRGGQGDMLESLSPELAIDVIPNGIELERFRARDTVRDENTLLFVGNYGVRAESGCGSRFGGAGAAGGAGGAAENTLCNWWE